MHYGFVKVCAATPEIRVADVKFNTAGIIAAIKESAENGSRLTVFPELCICGYTCGDLFNQSVLLDAVEWALKELCMATKGLDMLVFVGAPLRNETGSRLYNCAVALHDGRILGAVPKSYIADRRSFSPASEAVQTVKLGDISFDISPRLIFKAENFPEFTVAAEICEDLWAPHSPSVEHALAGANIIVNLSCSEETAGKAEFRRELVKIQSSRLMCGYVYCSSGDGESTTDAVFSGHNIIAENGAVLAESKLFENGLLYSEIDVERLSAERLKKAEVFYDGLKNKEYDYVSFKTNLSNTKLTRSFSKTPFIPENDTDLSYRAELILSIQAKGLEKRIKHTCASTAVIGVSGGLDSALALLVACRAYRLLDKSAKDIVAVTMPGFGTSIKTKSNSLKLMEELGVTQKTIPITDSVLQHFKDIGHDENTLDVTYENAQARMRTLILMDVANQTGGLVIGTGDLSELALGWATYNGDHMSMYGVNASVPKTLVRHLVGYEAKRIGGECEKILESILDTEISPELLPPSDGEIQQKTEDLVGPYILHDFFLYYAVRFGFKPDKIKLLALNAFKGVYGEGTITKWLRVFYKRFFSQQFKRSCVPDGVKVGSVALSSRGDWRMPSDAVAAVWLDDLN